MRRPLWPMLVYWFVMIALLLVAMLSDAASRAAQQTDPPPSRGMTVDGSTPAPSSPAGQPETLRYEGPQHRPLNKVPVATPMPKPPSIADARAWALAQFGAREFSCLDALVQRESRWRIDARNRKSGAYGLPQALPGTKMASAGADWRTNPITQLRWMGTYVHESYGTFCRALERARRIGWY